MLISVINGETGIQREYHRFAKLYRKQLIPVHFTTGQNRTHKLYRCRTITTEERTQFNCDTYIIYCRFCILLIHLYDIYEWTEHEFFSPAKSLLQFYVIKFYFTID